MTRRGMKSGPSGYCRCPFRHLGVPSLFPSVLCSFHPSGSGSSRWSLFQFPPASPAPTGCTERRAENRWDREENRGLQTLPWLVERRSASRKGPWFQGVTASRSTHSSFTYSFRPVGDPWARGAGGLRPAHGVNDGRYEVSLTNEGPYGARVVLSVHSPLAWLACRSLRSPPFFLRYCLPRVFARHTPSSPSGSVPETSETR